jgi:hypothetical protein
MHAEAMTYTFWHSGVFIGDSELEEPSDTPGQRAGMFHPTPYGLEIFPQLSGILSVGHALKMHLDANGLDAEEMDKDQVIELLDKTPAGQKLIDLGRMLTEVEMHGPDGKPLAFRSIAFSDLLELKRLARELDTGLEENLAEAELNGGPRYIVSATLQDDSASTDEKRDNHAVRRRHWPEDN